MKFKILIFHFFAILFSQSIVLQAQERDPVESMFNSVENYAKQKESNRENIILLQCDVLSEGMEFKVSGILIESKYIYEFYVKTSRGIDDMNFVVLDGKNTEEVLKQKRIVGDGSLTINNHDGVIIFGFGNIHYNDDAVHGEYALVISRTLKSGSSSNMTSPANKKDDGKLNPVSCNFRPIKGLSCKNTRQWTVNEDGKRDKKVKASFSLNSSLSRVEHKISKVGNFTYRISQKDCGDSGVYILTGENNLGQLCTIEVNMNSREITISPKGSDQKTIYDMEKIKN